jgi:hypothetical protein
MTDQGLFQGCQQVETLLAQRGQVGSKGLIF